MKEITKKYSNGEVTIVWKRHLCIHSSICWRKASGLPEVFKPNERPWITPEGASTEKIINQVKKCPSGALSFFMNGEEIKEEDRIKIKENEKPEIIIETVPDGPLIIHGNVCIRDLDGNEIKSNGVTSLCRCGASKRKPFCDDSHIEIGFKD